MSFYVFQAWRFWKESRPLDLIDSCMENSSVISEKSRCIHIGLLCVQQNPEDRPSMSTVVVMLSSESALPQPKEPAFLMKNDKFFIEADSSSKHQFSSTNDVSVTMLEPRQWTIYLTTKYIYIAPTLMHMRECRCENCVIFEVCYCFAFWYIVVNPTNLTDQIYLSHFFCPKYKFFN